MEQEVEASVAARLDERRVRRAALRVLDVEEEEEEEQQQQDVNSFEMSNTLTSSSEPDTSSLSTIALAASLVISALAFFISHDVTSSIAVFLLVGFFATSDPIDEDGPAGALARIIGRQTLRSVPKVRAVARAALTDNAEVDSLQRKMETLEQENAKLKLWIQRRMAVDDHASEFGMEELKDMARKHDLPVGGTKSRLMMRLVEEGVLELEFV